MVSSENKKKKKLNFCTSKAVVCPKKNTILVWIWYTENLSTTLHEIASLSSVSPPHTCSSM